MNVCVCAEVGADLRADDAGPDVPDGGAAVADAAAAGGRRGGPDGGDAAAAAASLGGASFVGASERAAYAAVRRGLRRVGVHPARAGVFAAGGGRGTEAAQRGGRWRGAGRGERARPPPAAEADGQQRLETGNAEEVSRRQAQQEEQLVGLCT